VADRRSSGAFLCQNAERGFGFGFAIETQEQVGKLAAQLVIGGLERECPPEFIDLRVVIGQ
jgi:hypothetical protein